MVLSLDLLPKRFLRDLALAGVYRLRVKLSMKSVKSIGNGLAIATFLLAAANLRAGDKVNPKDVPEPSVAAAWNRRLSAVGFDGLPLSEVVNKLREDFPELNFIVKEKARSETVSLILRSVTLEEFLKAIEPATDDRVRVIWPTNNNDRLVIFDRRRGSGGPIDPATGLPMSDSSQKICRVFNLSKYLANKSQKEADAAIEGLVDSLLATAWQMLRQANGEQEEDRPQLNIHRGTGLLIAVGRREDLDILEQVVKELQGSAAGSFDVAPRSAYYQLSFDLMRERAAQADSLVLLRQKEPELERAQELYNEKPPVITPAQYQLARTAVEVLKTTISARSNLIERLEADLKNFPLPEQSRGSRSGKD